LLKGFGAPLDRLDDGTFADFIADASGLEVFNHRLGLGVLFRWVDGVLPGFPCDF
jgi:hypothetical protein